MVRDISKKIVKEKTNSGCLALQQNDFNLENFKNFFNDKWIFEIDPECKTLEKNFFDLFDGSIDINTNCICFDRKI